MAGQPVVIVGTITDSEGNTKQVTITGIGTMAEPVFPAHPIAPGGPPPTVMPPIYYPPVFPAHPIAPGGPPPGIWPPPGGPVFPSHPIVLPEPPEVPTEPPIAPPGGGISEGWQWYYSPQTGWILVWKPPGDGGKPQPPKPPTTPTPSPTPHKP